MVTLHKFAGLNENAMGLLNKQRFCRLLAEEHISRSREEGDEFTALGLTHVNSVALSQADGGSGSAVSTQPSRGCSRPALLSAQS